MKNACEARREARRESIPLSRRGGGKPTEEGKPRGGVGGGAERSQRARRRDKAHPCPKGKGKRRPALRARRTAHGKGERAAGSAKRRAEHAPRATSDPYTRHPTAENMTRRRFLARPAGRNAPRNMKTRTTHPDAPVRRRGRAHGARPARRSCSRRKETGGRRGSPLWGRRRARRGARASGAPCAAGGGMSHKNSPRISAQGVHKKLKKSCLSKVQINDMVYVINRTKNWRYRTILEIPPRYYCTAFSIRFFYALDLANRNFFTNTSLNSCAAHVALKSQRS